MPLKIESGTYTVNPTAKKNISKFLLWKHWRRSVHEDRGEEDRRRVSGQTRGGGEVAGLEDVADSCAATLTPSVPGAGGIRSNRRTRPLSLAVQPLNYRRLDPDPKITGDFVTSHRPNMTSQESIGSCSLDADQSASDRSENTVDSLSKKTLHSLNLSCNGNSVSTPDNLANGSSETLQKSHLTPDEKLNVSNGHRGSPEPEQLTVKKPSYLGLACSISGYSGINRYDSKLREGFRSRDSSPGTRLITRDGSPAGFRSNDNLDVPAHPYPPKSQSISPLAMDRQNGFSNGLKEECKVEAYRDSRSSISICQGYSEVDKGVLHPTFPDISPIRSNNPTKRSPEVQQMMSCGQQNKSFSSHFSGSSPKQATANHSNSSFSDTSILNGSSVDMDSQILNTSSSSEKSFIQQRVERLYGPGALAQGFFFKRSASRLNASDSSFNKSSNNNDVSTDNANTEESLKNLPVLRHLRPEFRAQLPVVSPRRPTDGSEQILKPLQRVTPVSRKAEQKPKSQTPSKLDGSIVENNTPKLNSSVASIPDQQPAAPKVVLPVLEPSASSTNVAKQAQEAEKAEEKDGHYFLKLLKQETNRLLLLAASAEAELASGDTVALPEEAAGKLRSAAGKARLLASQKMQQFEGLCQKNINQVPGEEFPTTNEDLAGFWDMVMLQVVQVNELFDQIEKLRNSQWQETVPEKKPAGIAPQNGNATKRRVASIHKPKSTANSEANKKAREAREQARRQLIEERRRAMRSNAQNSENTVKIFVPDT
ncbi:Disks large-associated protein 4 [Dufourea novaeangliae]|uniref:Disks large-associated protein 4 n=1 Tax=Dufourea novaeangliae TaxID=178035 RepID=A0A154P5E8_DUFNO|nr:Disks large-associated protein 4 [Dufourea novaeangliae]